MKRAIGIDISKYQLRFNPEESAYNIDFVIARAGHSYNGIFYEDPKFTTYFSALEKIPIRLAYIYMDSGTTLNIQVEEFLDTVSKSPFEWDGFVCDWEGAYNTVSESFADKGLQWMNTIKSRTKKPVLLYTNRSLYERFWQIRGKNYPLWLAYPLADGNWTVDNIHNKQPKLPEGRDSWSIWQYSFTLDGPDWGVGSDRLDGNIYNGTFEEMKKFLKGENTPMPTEDKVLVKHSVLEEVEKDTQEYTDLQKKFKTIADQLEDAGEKLTAEINHLVSTAEDPNPPEEKDIWRTLVGLNVRSEPYVNDNKIGSIASGTKVEVLEYNSNNNNRWGRTKQGWIALHYNGNSYAEKT